MRPPSFTLRLGHPDFTDLPWDLSLVEWSGHCSRLEEAPRGLSRHPVLFANYDGNLYALKELPGDLARKEFELLGKMEAARIPCVTPVGYALTTPSHGPSSVLITRYLDHSLPYRSIFMSSSLVRYSEHLLDAIAGLMVQLHLAGIFWGDCSLSNTLFRRDAGALQAYLVDAETAEAHKPRLEPTLRFHDLEIMEENVDGDVADLVESGMIATGTSASFPLRAMGAYIRQVYQRLWGEVSREELIRPDEYYRIQERIRALNDLGFSVGNVASQPTEAGDQLRFRILVSDRNFHRDQLLGLTGIEAEENQARQMMNEILELKANLSRLNNRSTPLSVAAYHWLEQIYRPALAWLEPHLQRLREAGQQPDSVEVYCQILEHKWFLSERARRDVGHRAAVDDYMQQFAREDLPGVHLD